MKQIDQTYIYLISVYIEWKEKKNPRQIVLITGLFVIDSLHDM